MNNDTTQNTQTSQQDFTTGSGTLAYAIKRWSSRFENAQSRRTKDLNHSLTPHELNSAHLEYLMSEEGGPMALAVWHILIQMATRCPQRGLLVNEDGPLTDKDIAKACHLPEQQISRALSLLMSESIGWLDVVECPRQVLITGSIRSGRKGRPSLPEVLHVKGVEDGPDFHIERMISVVEHTEFGQESPQFKTVEILPYEFEVLLNPKKEESALEHHPEDMLMDIIKYWNKKGGNLETIDLLSVDSWYKLMKYARKNPMMVEVFLRGIDVIEHNSIQQGRTYTFEEVLRKEKSSDNAAA